jgi:hypothetical protein
MIDTRVHFTLNKMSEQRMEKPRNLFVAFFDNGSNNLIVPYRMILNNLIQVQKSIDHKPIL